MKTPLIKFAAAAAAVIAFALPAGAKEILFLSEDVPPSLDYDGANASAPPTQTGIVNLMEPLIYYKEIASTPEGGRRFDFSQFEGRLAESWSHDEATNTWTFNLRRGVKGCNGETFNADDVIYTMARAKSVSGPAPVGWFLSNVASIDKFTPAVFGDSPEAIEAKKLGDEVKKIDDYTVQFRQAASNKLFLPVLTIFALYIYDKEGMEAHATADDPWSHKFANNEDVSSYGPYCIENWEKDKEFAVTANPDYYRGKADVDRVIMRKVPQSGQRLVIIRSGQAHLTEHLTPKEFDSLRSAPNVKVISMAGNASTYVHMNWEKEPWDNITLRKAIAYALPYDQVIRDVFFNEATKYNGVLPSFYPGYHQASTTYDYDPEKAKALLAEAGFPNGQGLEQYEGAFELTYTAEKENILGPAATIILTALKGIGIPVTLNPIPQAQFSDRELVKKDLEFAVIDHSKPIGIEAAYAIQLLYVSRDKGGLSNYSLYSNAEVDDLFLDQAKTEPDDAIRNGLLAQIQEILMDEVVIAPLVETKLQWAMSSNLSGVGFHPEHSLRFYDFTLDE